MRPGLAGSFTLIGTPILSAVFMFMVAASSGACTNDSPGRSQVSLAGDVGSMGYELTGEVIDSADGQIVVGSAAVRDRDAYLLYTRTRIDDADDSTTRLSLISVDGRDLIWTNQKLFEAGDVEVGVIRFAVATGPAEYRLAEPGRSAPSAVVFRARNGAVSGADLMNAPAIDGDVGSRALWGGRAVIGPEVFATEIDLVDHEGIKIAVAAISIDNGGTMTTISDDELSALLDLHRR